MKIQNSGCRSSLIMLCSTYNDYNLYKSQNEKGETLLHITCRLGYLDIVQALIEIYKCTLNTYDKFGNSPCHSACAAGQLKIMDYFDKSAYYMEYKFINKSGDTLLHLACKSGSIPVIRMVITGLLNEAFFPGRNIKLNEYLDEVFSLLKLSYTHGSLLKTHGFLLNTQGSLLELQNCNWSGHTPLHTACYYGHIHVLKFFFTEFRHTFNDDLSCMIPSLQDIALENGNSEIVSYLSSHKTKLFNQEQVKLDKWGKRHGFKKKKGLPNTQFMKHALTLESVDPMNSIGDYSMVTYQKEPLLFKAARRGNKNLFEHIISSIEESIVNFPERNVYGDTLLHVACVTCDMAFFKEVYERIVNKHMTYEELKKSTNYFGNTCLHIVCDHGSLELTRFLVSIGFSINSKNNLEQTPLHLSILNDRQDVFEFLVTCNDVDINARTDSGETPLHMAACHDSCLAYARKIVSHRQFSNADHRDDSGETPLFNACRTRNMELVKILLDEAKCSIDIVNHRKETIAHIAVRSCWFELLDLVLSNPSYPKDDIQIRSLLQAAKFSTYYEVNGVDDKSMIQYLSDNMSNYTYKVTDDVNRVSSDTKLTPLQFACKSNNVKEFKQLLSIPGCDCDVKNEKGNTVLHICCSMNLEDIAKLCIEQSSVTIRNDDGDTPLHVAITSKNYSLFLFLLNQTKCNRLDNYFNRKGENILHVAARDGTPEILKAILNEKFVHHQSKNTLSGDTALHIACACDQTENAKCLFEYEYDTDSWYNIKGESPLYIAQKWTNGHLFEALLEVFPLKYFKLYLVKLDGSNNPLFHDFDFVEMPLLLCLTYVWLCCTYFCTESQKCDLKIDKFPTKLINQFIDSHSCKVIDSQGNTIFHYLAMCSYHSCECFRDIVQKVFNCHHDLITELNKNNVSSLQFACEKKCEWMIWKIIDLGVKIEFINDCNPQRRMIQSFISTQCDAAYFLVANGANHTMSSCIETHNNNHPLLQIFVIGDTGVGKSTLINTLKYFAHGQIQKDTIEPTTGIVIVDIIMNQSHYRCHDFAGQPQFEEGHAHFVENQLLAMQPSNKNAAVFLLMVKANQTIKENQVQIKKWLEFIKNCIRKNDLLIHIMLVCSHADHLNEKERYEITNALTSFFYNAITHPLTSKDIRICMNCQILENKIADRDSIKKLMSSLEEECIPLQTYCLSSAAGELNYFINKYFKDSPCQITTIIDKIKSCRKFSLTTSGQIVLEGDKLILPEIPQLLITLLDELHNHHFIVLLKQNEKDYHDGWIISKDVQEDLLSHTASLFSPSHFPNHPTLPDFTFNTGVVPIKFLKDFFKELQVGFCFEVFLTYLISMQYCIPVERGMLSEVLYDSYSRSTAEQQCKGELFFFPSFLQNDKDEAIYKKKDKQYFFGWVMKTKGKLGQRFLHTILLKLAFQFTPRRNPDNVFDRRLSLWKFGIFWCTEDQVEVLVEVRSDSEVLLLSRGISCYNVAKHTSKVVHEIRSIKEKLIFQDEDIPLLEEFCLHPTPVDYNSCDISTRIPIYDDVMSCFKKNLECRSYYVSNTEAVPLSKFLEIEPYIFLETEAIQSLNNDEQISQDLPKYIQDILNHCKCKIPGLSYSKLCSKLDEYSIFSGKYLTDYLSTESKQ